MTDQLKRSTLKILAVATGSAVTGALASMAIAGPSVTTGLTAGTAIESGEVLELASIEVTTRVSATNNELEVVLTNAGREAATITQMTPGVIKVARGQFNLAALLDQGPLHLPVGESVSVPLQHRVVSLTTDQVRSQPSLHEALKKSMSIITEGDSFASVSIVDTVSVT